MKNPNAIFDRIDHAFRFLAQYSLAIIAFLFAGASSVQGQVTGLQDLFTYSTTDITGHAPTTGAGTWGTFYTSGTNGTSVISTNGSAALLTANTGVVGSGAAVGNWSFTPQANTIYTLQTTWHFVGLNSGNADCWVGTGFSNSTGGGNNSSNPGPWMLIRPQVTGTSNGVAALVKGNTNVGNPTILASAYSSPIVTVISWNTLTNELEYYINGVEVGSTTTTAPSGAFNIFMQSFQTGNLVQCENIALYAQRTVAVQMQDDFTYTGNISGQTPTTVPSGWGSWGIWESGGGSITANNGDALINTDSSGTPGSGNIIASYPFTPFSNSIYTATATFNFTGTTSQDCWVGLGFSSAGTNHAPWMLIRPQASSGANGSVAAECNGAGWTGNSATLPASEYNGPITATVVWNSSTGVAQYYVDNLLVLTTPTASEYVPTGACNVYFQGFNLGNLVNMSNIALSDQDATSSQGWMAPVYGFNDFFNLFTSPNTTWPSAQNHIQVMQLGNLSNFQMSATNFKGSVTEQQLENAFTFCHNNGIKIAICAYGLQKDTGIGDNCGGGEGYDTTAAQKEDLQNIQTAVSDNGGVGEIDYVFFDGPLYFGVYAPPVTQGGNDYGCSLSISQAATETASVIEQVQSFYPNAQFI